MVLVDDFSLPPTAAELSLTSASPFYILFTASADPETKQAWCPDVRAAKPVLDAAFATQKADRSTAIVEVGQKPEWKQLDNVYRTKWNVNNIPALVRYEKKDGGVEEVARLMEDELVDEKKVASFLNQ